MISNAGERHGARLLTLAFLTCGDDLLLMRHPDDGDRFRGRWNGIGGHVEPGEDIRAAARRELREEAGFDPPDLRLRCVIHETGLLGRDHVVFVFVGACAPRELHSPEGRELAWQPVRGLSGLPLVDDLAVLLPRVLAANEPFFVTETYDGADRCTSLFVDGAGALLHA